MKKKKNVCPHRQEGGLERSEVRQEHPVSARHQHVLALDVAVTHAFAVALRRGPEQEVNQPPLLDTREKWPR